MVQITRAARSGKHSGIIRPFVAGRWGVAAVDYFPRVLTVAVPAHFERFFLGVTPVMDNVDKTTETKTKDKVLIAVDTNNIT